MAVLAGLKIMTLTTGFVGGSKAANSETDFSCVVVFTIWPEDLTVDVKKRRRENIFRVKQGGLGWVKVS